MWVLGSGSALAGHPGCHLDHRVQDRLEATVEALIVGAGGRVRLVHRRVAGPVDRGEGPACGWAGCGRGAVRGTLGPRRTGSFLLVYGFLSGLVVARFPVEIAFASASSATFATTASASSDRDSSFAIGRSSSVHSVSSVIAVLAILAVSFLGLSGLFGGGRWSGGDELDSLRVRLLVGLEVLLAATSATTALSLGDEVGHEHHAHDDPAHDDSDREEVLEAEAFCCLQPDAGGRRPKCGHVCGGGWRPRGGRRRGLPADGWDLADFRIHWSGRKLGIRLRWN